VEADLRSQQLIMIYANTIVDLLGFTGEDAARERFNLLEALNAGEPVDYEDLQRRADKQLSEDELRPALREHDLSDGEVDELVGRFFRRED
jgi:hypothetical protein